MSTRHPFVRAGAYLLVLAATVGGVYYATRSQPTPTASATTTPAAHNHAAGGAATSSAEQSVMISSADAQRIGVTYADVLSGPLQQEVRTVGQVTFDETAVRSIATKVDGTVERLVIDATGQYVTLGQPMLTIYSPMLVTAQEELLLAKRLRADVASADSSARQRAGDLVTSARQRLAYWDIPENDIAAIESGGAARKALTLRAPAGGYVLQKNVVAGQKVMAGEALFKVAELGTVWIEGEVFERDLAVVRVGATVQADLQALPGEVRTGRIAYVYPTLNPDTRTVRIRVVMPNPTLALKPGMYATLRIAGAAHGAVLSVPRSAVLSTGERSIVFVRGGNGELTPREVVIGLATDDRIEVLRGLTAHETVVASATFLVDGESNLGTALGGMGNMPGMDMTTPPKPISKKPE